MLELGFDTNHYKCDIEVSKDSKVFSKKGFTACDSSYAIYTDLYTPNTFVSVYYFGSPSVLGEVGTAAITIKAVNCISLLDNMTEA